MTVAGKVDKGNRIWANSSEGGVEKFFLLVGLFGLGLWVVLQPVPWESVQFIEGWLKSNGRSTMEPPVVLA